MGIKQLDTNLPLPADISQYCVSWRSDLSIDFLLKICQLTLPLHLLSASAHRQREYLIGRICAQKALTYLCPTMIGQCIPAQDDRSPCWPSGFVGSISHSSGYAIAAVAFKNRIESLGVDSESFVRKEKFKKIYPKILTPNEQTHLKNIGFDQVMICSLVFSAKESIFKCLYPICKRKFYFQDAEIFFVDVINGKFYFKILLNLHEKILKGFTHWGYFTFQSEMVHTGIYLQKL